MSTRRAFIRSAGIYSAGFLGLRRLVNQPLGAALSAVEHRPGFGRLLEDPAGLIQLPADFAYTVFSRTGEEMADGLLVPGMHDGMAAFAGPDGRTVLVRNHELQSGWQIASPYGPDYARLDRIDAGKIYDRGQGRQPSIGGTTTLVFDTREQALVSHHLSLAGTERNCAGGETPWGTWVTCEEVNELPEPFAEQLHGYNFEVTPTATPGLQVPVPLKGMGRFRHEAIAVDPRSGVVYQTEDLGDGLLYRYIPHEPGRLAAGGKLQALAIRGTRAADTRNWQGSPEFPTGDAMAVEWIDLEEIDSPNNDLRHRGHAAGAAVFARGEGAIWAQDSAYFSMTNGGRNLMGQIFRYQPSPYEGTAREADEPGRLELFAEPNDTELLRNGDNIVMAPWGDLVICEDTSGVCRIVAVTPEGEFYVIAAAMNQGSEFAGACFSPDGSTLFVNVQKPGYTIAITGPWAKRRLA